ncbi:unnamed protein product [Vitrella brassicaformis CCMP3155]|uniref:Uncharacterized protein n=1 Tax=Vitrella brassicaformis (strain CCMP3155) TaxID=1169540 RepID=A0A0G4EDX0_VITBC|nr:unnamed protein product [Vitrella brassicaformis CCMP3155]|eukprot:CEL93944.1 unnamed protein product [Vitrella brassicaformis CCMP3155]
MSDGHDSHMASAAMADGDGGDADDVAEEDNNGGGQPDGQDDSDADSDLSHEEDGEMAEEEGEGLQAAADSESESDGVQDDSDDDGGPLGDGFDDDDDDNEEDGHPVVAATTVEVPDDLGCLGPDDIEARFPHDTDDPTKQLTLGIIGRTITSPQQVTDLIGQGADPNVVPRLRQKSSEWAGFPYSLVQLAIDDKSDYAVPTIQAEDSHAVLRFVALPQGSSDELQSAVLTALLDGGADLNLEADGSLWTPIGLAIASGNQTAFELLMLRHDIDLRPRGPRMRMELPYAMRPPPSEYLRRLMSMFRHLIQRDPTLATEQRYGYNLVHQAA